jgi:hypothetical protein
VECQPDFLDAAFHTVTGLSEERQKENSIMATIRLLSGDAYSTLASVESEGELMIDRMDTLY